MRYDTPATREERLKNVPIILDLIADAALNYRPKRKAKQLKPRMTRKKRSVKDGGRTSRMLR